MTQQELADRVGVTRQTILALEAGRYNPSLALAMRIARVFGCAVEEVFTLAEESENNGAP
ncbi:MAG: helix-turn-helix transcriptional regulator [bacterium]|nr:helix-turn-helix transcriptional regulator [bacterium]